MKSHLVKSKAGQPCPREENARTYISEVFAETVPNTSYYRRRIADGSLFVVEKIEPIVVKQIEPKKKGLKK